MADESCPICCDKFTVQLRKPVKCQYCEFSACTVCSKKYLTEGLLDAHCMSCRRAWNDEFLDINFTRAFRTGAYKKHREDILLDREVALLPTRQPRVEARVKMGEVEEQMKEVHAALREWELKRQEILKKSNGLSKKLTRYSAEAEGRPPPAWTLAEGEKAGGADRAKFVMKCPDGGCRGFLSTAYKCGTCQLWACPDCLVIKGKEKDSDHTCDPGVKETVALIIRESKACPKCGERISKIDGCFAPNTPVLLWNGDAKMSQDITVGDELVGDDGEVRTVQGICSGEDEMYEVSQSRGMTYTVNSKHQLTLKYGGDKAIHWIESTNTYSVRWFDYEKLSGKSKKVRVTDDVTKEQAFEEILQFKDSLPTQDVYDIRVEDFLKLPENIQNNFYGYKATEVNWPNQKVLLDPYMLGIWLGDGIVNGTDFACCPEKDPEIVQYLMDWCNKNACELLHDDAYRFRVRRVGAGLTREAMGHGSTSNSCKGCQKKKCSLCDSPNTPITQTHATAEKNPLKEAIDYYGLLRNKHIPSDYLMNDRNTRLQLLAGLVDTDGYLGNDGKRIQIPQANHSLAMQIDSLASSLGFTVSVDVLQKKNIAFNGGEKKDYPDHLRVSISGKHLSDIPTRVARKKCVDSSPNKDWMKSSLRLRSVGRGQYHGWSVSGNKRFLLKDMTSCHNCDQMWCVDCHTAFSWTTGQLVTGVVHNPHYYEFLRQQGGGVAPRNAGDVPCGGVPYYHILQNCIKNLDKATQTLIMSVHRITAEITDYRMAVYQGHFNVDDNGDLGVKYLMKGIEKDEMKAELVKRELKRNKHLAIRAVLEMFVNTSTMMLNNIVSHPPGEAAVATLTALKAKIKERNDAYSLLRAKFETATTTRMASAQMTERQKEKSDKEYTDLQVEMKMLYDEMQVMVANRTELEEGVRKAARAEFGAVVLAYMNLRTYVNESLMGVARMKNCSVPQIGDDWLWKPFNKCVAKTRVKKAASEATATPAPAAAPSATQQTT